MAAFIVRVKEIHVSMYRVQALDEAEAKQKVQEGDGEEIDSEYLETMDSDTWTVEDEEPEDMEE